MSDGSSAEGEARRLRARIAELEAALATAREQAGAADTLRGVEAQYRHLLDVLPEAVFIHLDERIAFVNLAAVRLYGVAGKADLIGQPSLSLVPPEFRDQQRIRCRMVLEERRAVPPIEQQRQRPDGTMVWVETSATFTLWDGKPAFLGVARDITARKRAEAALDRAHTRLEAITQNIPGAVYERVLHSDGRLEFTYLSPGVQEFSGISAEAIMADATGFLDRIRPEFRDEYRARMAESAARLTPLDIEIPIAGARGEPRWIRSQGRPRRREDGAVVWDGLIIDITAQRETEERARRLHDWLLGAIESMPNGFMLWDPDDRLVMWNRRIRATLPGWEELRPGMPFEELIRAPCEQIRAMRGDAAAASWRERRVRHHRDGDGDFQFEGESGRWFVISERRTSDGFTVTAANEITGRVRNEQLLRDSEAQYRSLLEDLPDGVIVQVDGRLAFVNAAAVSILGAGSKDRLIGRPVLSLVPPEYQAAQLERRRMLLDGTCRIVPLAEQRRQRLDGRTVWVENISAAIRWEGKPAILGVLRDITEKKDAQHRAQRLDHWLRGAIDSMPEGFMLWDPEDRLVLWNEQILRFFPHPERLMEGASFETLMQGTAESIRRRRGDQAAEDWLERRRRQRREASGAHEFAGRNGLHFVVAERRTAAGFTVTLVTDVTEHRQSEDRLRDAQRRYRALIDLSPDAIYVHRGGRVVLCNERAVQMFGAPDAQALIGRHTLELIDPEFHELVRDRQAQLASVGTKTIHMRQRRLRLDGTAFWAEVAAAIVDWDGARGGIVIVRDVTSQMQSEDQLYRSKEAAELANRAKTEFLANISHELRTPLNAIIGFSDVMQRELFGPLGNEQYRAYARDIHQSGTHLHEVINDILDLSKIEAGKLDLHEERVDVDSTVRRCLRLLRPRADAGEIALEARIAPALPALHADARKLKQILINLLSNAVKFTEPGGSVAVEAALDGQGGLAIAVADTGIGMAAEDIPTALQPFGQLDSALNRKYEGTGLGLPLSKSLAELHGCDFTVESTPGKGTRVTLRFPPERVLVPAAAE